jgi:hypothetical protein
VRLSWCAIVVNVGARFVVATCGDVRRDGSKVRRQFARDVSKTRQTEADLAATAVANELGWEGTLLSGDLPNGSLAYVLRPPGAPH